MHILRNFAVIFLLLHLPTGNSQVRAGPPPTAFQEYEIKAAFIYNFAKFIDWPPQSFPDASSPIIVGVTGRDPFGAILDRALEGQTVKDRPVHVKRLSQPYCADCHLLFISPSEKERLPEILPRNHQRHVVTISDIPRFDAKGGIIYLFLDQNRVRFHINTQAAESAGVHISSQLLKLSRAPGGA